MPAGIAAADRKLLMAGGGLVVVMALTIGLLSPPGDSFDSKIPSTYSAQSSGAAAAYRLLNALHYPVRRWENSPTELNEEAGNTLLILAEPNEPPTAKERQALDDFVKEGGHALLPVRRSRTISLKLTFRRTMPIRSCRFSMLRCQSQITREAANKSLDAAAGVLGNADTRATVTIRRAGFLSRGQLAERRGRNTLVGGFHSADQCRDHAQRQSEVFSQFGGEMAGCIDVPDLLGRIFPRAAHILVELCREDVAALDRRSIRNFGAVRSFHP